MADDEQDQIRAELARRYRERVLTEPAGLAEVAAELARRYSAELARVDTDTELSEVRAELARRAAAKEGDEQDEPMKAVAQAIAALAAAFAEMAGAVAQMTPRPVVKTIERDANGDIARIFEEPVS